LCEDLAVGQPVGDGVADLVFRYAPVVGVFSREPFSQKSTFDLFWWPLQELFEAMLEPDSSVPVFLADAVGVGGGERQIARLNSARQH
jgi:hypothetical protein